MSDWRLGTAAISDWRLVSGKAMEGRIKALLPEPQRTALALLYARLGKACAPIKLVRR
jgi:DNA polymerase III psi subunit